MADILQDFPIRVAIDRVFAGVSTPKGLDEWWTKRSTGEAREGAEYELWFGPAYDWRARVTKSIRNREFELEFTRADADWLGTRVRFLLEPRDDGTWVQFAHTGWPTANEHYRISTHCWALYLRILRRWLEHDERVAYEQRLDA